MSATVRIAVLQMTSGIDPEANADQLVQAIESASRDGAAMMFTPEMSGLLDRDRARASKVICAEDDDRVLKAVRKACAQHNIWCSLGSLALRRADGRFANRSFVIDDCGAIRCRYDKIHMFDVDLGDGDNWRESAVYEGGDRIATAQTPIGRLGLAICYDLRFPALFDALGRQFCDAIAIPSAFTVPTGRAHWHVLVRARAIEASAFVIAAAQVGHHEDGRVTYGHSLVVDPWGEVLLDMGGERPGLGVVEIDLDRIAEVRARLPSLANRRQIANEPVAS